MRKSSNLFWLKKVHAHSSCVPIRKSIMPPAPLSDRLRWSPSPAGISVASTRDIRPRRRKRTQILCGRRAERKWVMIWWPFIFLPSETKMAGVGKSAPRNQSPCVATCLRKERPCRGGFEWSYLSPNRDGVVFS